MEEQKIVIATDSYKGSASSEEVEDWIEAGIRRVLPLVEIIKIPIADGGEGTVKSLTSALNGKLIKKEVEGPLGVPQMACFGMLDSKTAVIEMAEASGITLIEQNGKDVLHASTYGVGQLMAAALDQGAKEIYIGLGGSATNDGGTGMAQALGIALLDNRGNEIPRGAIGLPKLQKIDLSTSDPRLKEVTIKILSDVTNPLTGENGATAIYGPQKGLRAEDISMVDEWLKHYSDVIFKELGQKVEFLPGAGAAGGLGAGLQAFFKTEMHQGIAEILRLLKVEEKLQNADLVITGEGKMDSQSTNGKAPIGIAQLAKKYNIPVIAIVGSRDEDLAAVYEAGIDLVLSVLLRPTSLAEAMAETETNVKIAGETAIRAFLLLSKKKGDIHESRIRRFRNYG